MNLQAALKSTCCFSRPQNVHYFQTCIQHMKTTYLQDFSLLYETSNSRCAKSEELGNGLRPNQSDCRISNLDQSEGRIWATWLGSVERVFWGLGPSLGSSLARPTWDRGNRRWRHHKPEVTSSNRKWRHDNRKSTTDHVVWQKHDFLFEIH